jgi:hypothetical protein
MDSSSLANSYFGSEFRRVCIFGLCVETLSPGPVCMRSPVPLRPANVSDRADGKSSGMRHKWTFEPSLAERQLPGVKQTLLGADSRRPEGNVTFLRKLPFK